MLRFILADLTLFAPGDDVEQAQKDLNWWLHALTQRDQDYLLQHPETPHLYKSGVRYEVPKQFAGECEEVRVLRQALGRAARRGDVARALDLVQQVLGGERFRDIGRITENGGGDCFPLSQKVIVRSKSTGLYELLTLGELRHIYPSYEALSYSFTRARYEFRDIVGFVDKGVKPIIRAHLSNGADITATADHKFWTLEGSARQAKQIGFRTMGEYAEAVRLSRSRRAVRTRILQAARVPVLGAVRPGSAKAYLAGIYAAEGYFDGHHTAIAQYKPAVRAKIERALAAVETGFRYRGGSGKTPGSGAYYALHGGRKNPIVAMMREQGISSFSMGLPQAFLSGDEETLTRLVEGHGDGDAWRPAETAFKRPGMNAIYATSSDALMEQLRFVLLALGRPTYAYRYEDHQGVGNKPIWRLHEYAATDENSTLRKRREIVERDFPGLTYGIVLDAAEAGEAHVGCIEVEENHNFILADGTIASNCDNLACWRAAELRQAGIEADPCMTHRKRADGGTTYHALVRWPPHDGVSYDTSEDPSLLLGMGGPDRAADRAIEIQKNQERCEILRARGAGDVFLPAAPGLTVIDRELAGALGLGLARRALASSSDLLSEIDDDLRRRRVA